MWSAWEEWSISPGERCADTFRSKKDRFDTADATANILVQSSIETIGISAEHHAVLTGTNDVSRLAMSQISMLAEEWDRDYLSAGNAYRFKRVQFQHLFEAQLLRQQLQRNITVQQSVRLGNDQTVNPMTKPQQRFED